MLLYQQSLPGTQSKKLPNLLPRRRTREVVKAQPLGRPVVPLEVVVSW